jgi:hypothetical protein
MKPTDVAAAFVERINSGSRAWTLTPNIGLGSTYDGPEQETPV